MVSPQRDKFYINVIPVAKLYIYVLPAAHQFYQGGIVFQSLISCFHYLVVLFVPPYQPTDFEILHTSHQDSRVYSTMLLASFVNPSRQRGRYFLSTILPMNEIYHVVVDKRFLFHH